MTNQISLQPPTGSGISRGYFIPRGTPVNSGVLTACIGVCLFDRATGEGYGRHFFPSEIRAQLPEILERAQANFGDYEVFVAGASVNQAIARFLGLTSSMRIDSTRQVNNEIKRDIEIIIDERVPRDRSFISWSPEDTNTCLYGNNDLMNLRVVKDITGGILFKGDAKKSPYLRRIS